MTCKSMTLIGLAGLASLTLGGCPIGDPRLTNQGGGSLLTVAGKALGGNLSAITPDEIQVITDFAIAQTNAPIDPVPDDVAETVVDLINQNNINTLAELENLINNPETFNVTPEQLAVLEAFAAGQAANVTE